MCGCIDVDDQLQGQGTFQTYVNLAESSAGTLPNGVEFAEACVLPLAMCTAAVGLFERGIRGWSW
jgi:NADPH:quinone reductase-like Zn-dependent oxidoreductase